MTNSRSSWVGKENSPRRHEAHEDLLDFKYYAYTQVAKC